MKTKAITLALLVSTASLFANTHLAWVDEQVAAIKPPRKGVSNSSINRLSNPFIKVHKESKNTTKTTNTPAVASKPKAVVKPLSLKSVMNQAALIGSNWYQVNDNVRGYTVTKIESNSVLLVNGKKQKKLFITQDNSKINITVK